MEHIGTTENADVAERILTLFGKQKARPGHILKEGYFFHELRSWPTPRSLISERVVILSRSARLGSRRGSRVCSCSRLPGSPAYH